MPLVAAAPAPLTPAELKAGEENFKQGVDGFLAKGLEVLEDGLMLNWNMGNFCIDMNSDPKRFANHSAEDFAKALSVSSSSVYKYVDFARSETKDKVIALAKQNIPWRSVIALMTVNSPEKRATLEARLITTDDKKHLNSDELQQEVKKINAKERDEAKKKGVKLSNRGGARPIITIRSFAGLLQDVLNKQEEFKQAYTDFKKMPADADQKQIKEEVQLAFKNVKMVGEAMTKLDDYRKRLAKSEK